MTQDSPLLAVNALTKSYGGVRAVRDVSFTLAAGEILALIGPNGAGKTTCFNLLNGQTPPDSGQVLLAGHDITGWTPSAIWRRGVGRTFQITATFSSMTVRENVQVALIAHRARIFDMLAPARDIAPAETDRLLALVDMAGLSARPCGELAYGDLKRLELAIALASAPTLLLMDEPTAGMAPRERLALMQLTTRIAREQSIGILFTEHDMDIVFEHADRIIVLNRGAIICEGSPDTVRRDPQVKAVYLGDGLVFTPETRMPA